MNSKKLLCSLLMTSALSTAAISTQAQKATPQTKEISQEVPSQKGSLIRVVTGSRKVIVKTWDQPKVKVTIELEYSDSASQKRSDADWFDGLGINIKPFTNRVDILTNTSNGFKPGPGPGDGKKFAYDAAREVFKKDPKLYNKGQQGRLEEEMVKGYAKPVVRVMNILVPTGSKLDLDTKYSDVTIGMNLDEAKLDISNGALDAQDIKHLQLTASYCNANLGSSDKAEIEFYNGTFRAQNINDLDLDARGSTFEYEKGNYIYLRSQNDNITIASIDKLDGRKLYGSLKIDLLTSSFDLEGNNADIKFRDISPEVTLIKINDRYGDLRLPVKSLKNFYVDFIGNYSTVFAPFQKEVVKDEEKKDDATAADNTKTDKNGKEISDDADKYVSDDGRTRVKGPRNGLGEVAPRHFNSTVGDTKGKHTRIELTCHSCTVDFK